MILEYPIYIFTSKCYASDKLSPELPHKSQLSRPVYLSILGHCVIQAIYQILIYIMATTTDWFEAQPKNGDFNTDTYESTVVFLASLPLHVFPIIVIEFFTPFRKKIVSNKLLFASIVIQIIILYWLILLPLDAFKKFFEIKTIKRSFLLFIIGASFVMLFAMFLYELFVVKVFGRSEPINSITKNKSKND